MSDAGGQLAAGSARQSGLKILRVAEDGFNLEPDTRLQVSTANAYAVAVGSGLNEPMPTAS